MGTNQIQLRIHWGETDRAGIVFYPNYFKWFDIASHAFFRSFGFSPASLESEYGVILPVLEVHSSFVNPLDYDEVVLIETRILEIRHKTIKLEHEIFRDGLTIASGYEVRAWVQKGEGGMKAVPIPREVKQIILGNPENNRGC